ncbi:ATP-binding cassette domain-containing protein [Chengkuizengella sp. SCS-71B]|uniref:ABC transporter ATP-binding protein n=1 Tax=Chengkuizengella sp. SCS-71B TaxID=3115290 RepID=UPI0032C21265
MQVVLETKNLLKNYGSTEALKNINIKLEENKIYGLLGRNGAGKTTFLNLISGSIFQDEGDIHFYGNQLKKGETPKPLCYVKEKNLFFGGAKVIDLLDYAAPYYENWDWDFAKKLLNLFELDPNKKFKKLSRGMESLVGITIGLASRAPITAFDEPVLGLDPLMREKFYNVLVEDYAEHPRTIFMSTHLIDEVSKIVEKIFIMESGSIKLADDMENIKNKSYFISGKNIEVESFLQDKNMIHRETHGSITIAAIYDTLSNEEKEKAATMELSVDNMPLQKFFSYYSLGGEDNE